MKKPILTLSLVAMISLIAMGAHADIEGPGYGQDPNAEPPRTGVGNANSGNHNMHVQNHRERWAYGVDASDKGPHGSASLTTGVETPYVVIPGYIVEVIRLIDAAVLR